MNAKAYNKAMTKLFFGGDPLGVMMRDGMRQVDELVQEARELWLRTPESSCPCGCGQVGVCDDQLARVIALDDDIPF